MTINQQIKAAVEPIVPVCVPDPYTGEETEYCTFDYTEIPEEFGDDMPELIRYAVQLHYFCPLGYNPIKTKRLLFQAILAADFTAPEIINAGDETSQHYVFEFEALGGV